MVQASDLLDELLSQLLTVARSVNRPREGLGMDKAAIFVLWQLSQTAPVRPSACAHSLALDQSTVSRHLKSLESGGYVRRSDDPEDGRAHLFELTPDGHRMLAEHHAARRERIGAALADWSDAEQRRLTRLLGRLAEDLQPAPELAPV
ncbi:MarR family transcriptional regulator [soil metagenome]